MKTVLPLALLCLVGCTRPEPTQGIDPAGLRPGPIRHAALTPDQERRVIELQKTFADVDPSPAEKWVEDFKRDENPDREIAIWESIAAAYRAYCAPRTLTAAAKRDVFALLLSRSAQPSEDVLKSIRLNELSQSEARIVLEGYVETPRPIVVE